MTERQGAGGLTPEEVEIALELAHGVAQDGVALSLTEIRALLAVAQECQIPIHEVRWSGDCFTARIDLLGSLTRIRADLHTRTDGSIEENVDLLRVYLRRVAMARDALAKEVGNAS